MNFSILNIFKFVIQRNLINKIKSNKTNLKKKFFKLKIFIK